MDDNDELLARLARFTSLDNETIKSQIVPYLDTLGDNESTIRHHLMDLIGPGVEQTRFVDDWLRARRGVGGVTTERSGGAGASLSSSAVVAPSKSSPAPMAKPAPTPKPTPSSSSTFTPTPSSSSASTATPGFTLAPSDEMQALDEEIAQLSLSSSSSSTPPLPCHCQGRRHALSTYNPICHSCGLLLCSASQPPPTNLNSNCSSCSAPLFTQSQRNDVLASLHARRAEAEQRAIERAERVRAERAASKGNSHDDASLFPQLAGGDAIARRRALEVDYAMGRKVRPGESGFQSSASNQKARVLTIGKKGKVYVGNGPQKKKKKDKGNEDIGQHAASPVPAPPTPEPPRSPSPPLDVDAECERLGLVIDYDDDGRRGERQQAMVVNPLPPPLQLRYVPAAERRPRRDEEREGKL